MMLEIFFSERVIQCLRFFAQLRQPCCWRVLTLRQSCPVHSTWQPFPDLSDTVDKCKYVVSRAPQMRTLTLRVIQKHGLIGLI